METQNTSKLDRFNFVTSENYITKIAFCFLSENPKSESEDLLNYLYDRYTNEKKTFINLLTPYLSLFNNDKEQVWSALEFFALDYWLFFQKNRSFTVEHIYNEIY